MHHESDTTHRLAVAYGVIPDHDRWLPSEMVDIFARLLINGWETGDMTPRMAQWYGSRLGHYGRLALAEQEQATWAGYPLTWGDEG